MLEHNTFLFSIMNIVLSISLLLIALASFVGKKIYQRYKDTQLFSHDMTHKQAVTVLVVGACFFVILFSITLLSLFDVLSAGSYDLGNMNQAIWNTAHGDVLRMTTVPSFTSRLFIHVEPIFLAIAPLYLFWQDPRFLLILQTFVLAASVFPIYSLIRHTTGMRLGGVLGAVLFLVLPSLHLSALFQFHSLILAIPFLLYGISYFERRRFSVGYIFFLVAMMCREDIALVVAAYGLVYVLTQRTKVPGVFLGVTGITWSCIAYVIILPSSQVQSTLFQSSFFPQLGGESLAPHIVGMLVALSFFYIIFVSAQFFFLSFKRILYVLPALVFVPHIFFRPNSDFLLMGHSQYTIMFGIIFFIAAVFALQRVASGSHPQRALLLLIIMIAISCLLSFQTVYSVKKIYVGQGWFVAEERKQAREDIRSLITQNDSVTASPTIAPYFSSRKNLYATSWGNEFIADYVILDSRYHEQACGHEPGSAISGDSYYCQGDKDWYTSYTQTLPQHGYELIYTKADIQVFKKDQTTQL